MAFPGTIANGMASPSGASQSGLGQKRGFVSGGARSSKLGMTSVAQPKVASTPKLSGSANGVSKGTGIKGAGSRRMDTSHVKYPRTITFKRPLRKSVLKSSALKTSAPKMSSKSGMR